jgi:hypothetical protein
MPSSPFSKNCKPPKPPILALLSGGLSVNMGAQKPPLFQIKMFSKSFGENGGFWRSGQLA